MVKSHEKVCGEIVSVWLNETRTKAMGHVIE